MKSCESTHIINPKTGRCVLKTGAIGQKLLGAKPSSSSITKKYTKKYGKDLMDKLPTDFKIIKQIGKGEFGTIHLTCKGNCSTKYVLKIQIKPTKMSTTDFIKDIEREITLQKKFHNHKLAPKIITDYMYTYKGKLHSVIVMESVGILDDMLNSFPKNRSGATKFCKDIAKAVNRLMNTMCRHGLTHGDMHNENIGFLPVREGHLWEKSAPYQLILIDFGMSYPRKCRPSLELLQLIRSLMMDRTKSKNKKLIDCLIVELYKIYVRRSDDDRVVGLTIEEIEAGYLDEYDEQQLYLE